MNDRTAPELDPEVESTVIMDAPTVKPELLPKGLNNRLGKGDEAVSAAELLRRKGIDSERIRAARDANTGASWTPPPPARRPDARKAPAASPAIPRSWIVTGLLALLAIVGAAGFAGFVIGQSGSRR